MGQCYKTLYRCNLVPFTVNYQDDVALQHRMMVLKNVNNCLNTNIHSYSEISGGQGSNLYLNVVPFFNASVNYTSVAA